MTQSLEIRQIVTGKNSFGVALSYYDRASVHNKRGEYEQIISSLVKLYILCLTFAEKTAFTQVLPTRKCIKQANS